MLVQARLRHGSGLLKPAGPIDASYQNRQLLTKGRKGTPFA
jgi:hypothetical protein